MSIREVNGASLGVARQLMWFSTGSHKHEKGVQKTSSIEPLATLSRQLKAPGLI